MFATSPGCDKSHNKGSERVASKSAEVGSGPRPSSSANGRNWKQSSRVYATQWLQKTKDGLTFTK
jgi:hypothetical protein